MITIGFLLPRSTVYPLIGYDFLDGFNAYLELNGFQNSVKIVTENIGFGLDEAEIYTKNEQLLVKEKAHLVVAFVDGRIVELLEPLYTAMNKLLIVVNMGTHYPIKATPGSTVIQHTFNVGFNSYLTGQLAAIQNYLLSAIATSYYDGGYLQCHAMSTSYINKGGSILHNFISPFKPSEFNIQSLTHFLTNSKVDTLLCLFSGDVGDLFLKQIADYKHSTDLHLFVSPMLLDEHLTNKLKEMEASHTIEGYTSWLSILDNQENKEFCDFYKKITSKNTSLFSLLGWEIGIFLKELMPLLNENEKAISLIKYCKTKVWNTPRGNLYFEENTNETYGNAYQFQIDKHYATHLVSKKEVTLELRNDYLSLKPEGAASGWRNTYLCS